MIENFYPNPLLVGRSLHASLEHKGLAFEKITPINGYPGRYRPDDELVDFLKGL
jgi:hypothetical protein